MNLDYIIYSFLISTCIMLAITWFKHSKNVNIFYSKIADLLEFYYKQHPRTPNEYFLGIVIPKTEANISFWVKDFNDFILDSDRMTVLYKGAQKYIDENCIIMDDGKPAEVLFTPEGQAEIECPWCSANMLDDFEWMEFEEDNPEKLGTISCKQCGATCPSGTFQECQENMKAEE